MTFDTLSTLAILAFITIGLYLAWPKQARPAPCSHEAEGHDTLHVKPRGWQAPAMEEETSPPARVSIWDVLPEGKAPDTPLPPDLPEIFERARIKAREDNLEETQEFEFDTSVLEPEPLPAAFETFFFELWGRQNEADFGELED